MGYRYTSDTAQIAGRVGGVVAGAVRRRRACERALGPLDTLMRQAIFDVRADLSIADLKPLLDLLPRAYLAGYERGYRSGWKRNLRTTRRAA